MHTHKHHDIGEWLQFSGERRLIFNERVRGPSSGPEFRGGGGLRRRDPEELQNRANRAMQDGIEYRRKQQEKKAEQNALREVKENMARPLVTLFSQLRRNKEVAEILRRRSGRQTRPDLREHEYSWERQHPNAEIRTEYESLIGGLRASLVSLRINIDDETLIRASDETNNRFFLKMDQSSLSKAQSAVETFFSGMNQLRSRVEYPIEYQRRLLGK